ncbi:MULTISPECIES: YifB family Mg chelatase-like AAA ATPase [unclassified Corynebacterium]|uniref:YifB family Mg chelatase-like AAA ATPase n=1 Tax=unclassified Corynebacterium TaxID=2624378 RepID=UPI003524CF44
MALGSTRTAAVTGIAASIVDVEASVGRGLPGIHVLGLGDTAVSEARDRIRTACLNSSLPWPRTRIVVSLSPASLPKSGSGFDLAMALAVLTAGDQSEGVGVLDSTLILGEIGLDGAVRPVTGVLPALLAARDAGLGRAVVPRANAAEAALVPSFPVFIVDTLDQAFRWAVGRGELASVSEVACGVKLEEAVPDFSDVLGQPEARLAAEIAAAGGHHMLMTGPPGSGKSMIAARLPGILPSLSERQRLEVTAVHSVAGRTFTGPVLRAPFVAPHHSITRAALLGGGAGSPLPGAVSLAHHGVLFLDEVSEIPAGTLDSLRTPLDTGMVRVLRSRRDVTFPARFQLVLAANPCRCAAESARRCRCRSGERARHLSNLSGPLRDRIDLHVTTRARGAVVTPGSEESSVVMAERVAVARERASYRWRHAGGEAVLTADISGAVLRRDHAAEDAAMAFLASHTARGRISQRRVDRTLRLAWTLADLEQRNRPDLDHIARALEYSVSGGMEPADD